MPVMGSGWYTIWLLALKGARGEIDIPAYAISDSNGTHGGMKRPLLWLAPGLSCTVWDAMATAAGKLSPLLCDSGT